MYHYVYCYRQLVEFLQLLYKAYADLYFTYLEINPLGEHTTPHTSLNSYIGVCMPSLSSYAYIIYIGILHTISMTILRS